MDRKKALKEEYKNLKPPMGIIGIRSKTSSKYLLLTSKNLKATINKVRFQLNFDSYLNEELQSEWNKEGENSFDFIILEELSYDKDDSKVDYSEDLEILKVICQERLKEEGVDFYKD